MIYSAITIAHIYTMHTHTHLEHDEHVLVLAVGISVQVSLQFFLEASHPLLLALLHTIHTRSLNHTHTHQWSMFYQLL